MKERTMKRTFTLAEAPIAIRCGTWRCRRGPFVLFVGLGWGGLKGEEACNQSSSLRTRRYEEVRFWYDRYDRIRSSFSLSLAPVRLCWL
jgi:hypothetical protein